MLTDVDRPHGCLMHGVDCRRCVSQSAESVARICENASVRGIHRIFYGLYSDPACACMVHEFERAYAIQMAARPAPPAIRAMPAREGESRRAARTMSAGSAA